MKKYVYSNARRVAASSALLGLLSGLSVAVDLQVSQVGWLSDSGGYSAQYSTSGLVGIQFHSSDASYFSPASGGGYGGYLNIFTSNSLQSGNWAVQNIYIGFDSPSDLNGDLMNNYFFNIGSGSATGSTTNLGGQTGVVQWGISAAPIASIADAVSLQTAPVTISNQDALFGGAIADDNSFSGGTGQGGAPNATNTRNGAAAAASKSVVSKIKIKETDTEPIDEQKNHCGPGSVTKSLKYLEKQGKINTGLSTKDIYDDLKGRMATTEAKGTFQNKWIDGKKAFTTAKKLGIDTSFSTDIDAVSKCLDEGADIELFVYQGKDGATDYGGHFTFVSKITRTVDGTGKTTGYAVDTINDLVQGDGMASNVKITYTFDAAGNCTSHFPGAKLYGFMVEKAVPEPSSIVALGIGVAAVLRRRGRK